jgi:uncharacterized protein (TIGR02646 family)
VKWRKQVARALPDYAGFLLEASRFEKLGINSKARRSGFARYAPDRADFPAIWGRHKELIAAMSHRKCVYCEGPINAPRAAHVEHFKPKALFPSLAFEWTNYFLGCSGCNGAKSDRWPKRGGYIRPDRGDPSRHFAFADDGTVTAARPRSAADRMLEDFDLKRRWLSDERKLNIGKMLNLLSEAVGLFESGHKAEARRLALVLLGTVGGPEAAYSVALTQCFWRAWKHACPGGRL